MPDDAGCPALRSGPDGVATIVIPGNSTAVRAGLQAILSDGRLTCLAPDSRASVQIVLAEVLNNIVEHAYAERPGQIEISIRHDDGALACRICDSGAALPGRRPPAGTLPPLEDVPSLPEGGFGWFLIRSLVSDLTYQRENGRNLLSFRLNCEQSPGP